MASISNIDGKWRALIRRKGYEHISKWFPTKTKAQAWANAIEKQMSEGTFTKSETTIGDLIDQYRRLRSKARPILDTSNEHYMLKQLTANLGGITELTVDDLLGWAVKRKDDGAGPFTINNDLSKLGTILRHTDARALPVLAEARPKLSYLGLIGGGGMRERRPTEEELHLLREYLAVQYGGKYVAAMDFSIITAMRRGEVCAIRFDDIDEEKRLIKVMRKHPRKGKTLEWVPLMEKAWALVQQQPRTEDRIFPIHPQTLSKYFKGACDALGIPDLHWHDFRHEGTSALFEAGYLIPQVALVTGHKSWAHLKRYTNLRPESMSMPPSSDTDQSTPQHPANRTSASRLRDK